MRKLILSIVLVTLVMLSGAGVAGAHTVTGRPRPIADRVKLPQETGTMVIAISGGSVLIRTGSLSYEWVRLPQWGRWNRRDFYRG